MNFLFVDIKTHMATYINNSGKMGLSPAVPEFISLTICSPLGCSIPRGAVQDQKLLD